jgi:hypothetical protein
MQTVKFKLCKKISPNHKYITNRQITDEEFLELSDEEKCYMFCTCYWDRFTKYLTKQLFMILIEYKAPCSMLYDLDNTFLNYDMELMIKLVSNYRSAIKYIPKEKQTAEICQIAIENKCQNISYIDDSYLNYDLCKKAVICNYVNIKKVPCRYLTRSFCDELISAGCYSIIYEIGSDLLSYSSLLEIARNHYCSFLNKVPEDIQTEELCYIACKKHIENFPYVADCYKTYDMCYTAIKHQLGNLRYVPYRFIDEKMYKLIVRNI